MSAKQQKNQKYKQDSPEKLRGENQAVVEHTTITNEAASIWKALLKSGKNDLIGGVGESVSTQVLGGGTLQEGQAVSLKQKQPQAEKVEKHEKQAVSSEFAEYKREVINADRISDRQTEQQVVQAVDQIRMEIQKLVKTSKLVERTVKDATADQAPVRAGKYHVHFFEFVLGILRDATRKLEDTVSYGAVFQSKKQQSKYWNSYKKSGTSFGLSGERTVATQVG